MKRKIVNWQQYHEAKQELARLTRRIKALDKLIEKAKRK